MTSSPLARPALALALAAALAAPAVAAGNAEMGKQLADQWCSNCHVVGNSARGSDAAPALPAIAQQRGQDPAWLKAWLTSPHPPMPNLNLSRQEIDDITAYLASLKKP